MWAYGGVQNCLADTAVGPPSLAPTVGMAKGPQSRCYQLAADLVPTVGMYFPGLQAGCFETGCASNGTVVVRLRLGAQLAELACPSGG